MDYLSPLVAIIGVLSLVFMFTTRITRTLSPKNNSKKSTPELSGAWPVVGHLHLLGSHSNLGKTLGAFADKCGPIFTIRLGVHPTVVVSNWEAVKDCFTTNDKIFANRPKSSHGEYLGYNYAGFGFQSYGPFWRDMRKLALIELLSSHRLDSLRHVRVSELDTSIKMLYSMVTTSNKKDSQSQDKIVLSQWLQQLTLNIIIRMISGKRFSDGANGPEEEAEAARHFNRLVREFMHISGQFVLSDVIPVRFLRWIDLQGHIRSMKRVAKELDTVFEGWIQEHLQRRLMNEAVDKLDFIEVLSSAIDDGFTTYGHSRDTIIKATLQNLVLAGSDTTSLHLTWVLSLLLNNANAMRIAREEIETKIGKDRWVEESDIKNLVYLQAVVKETLRLYPPAPVGVPHEAMEDCTVCEYNIPKGTRLFVNVWKLHRDPRIWSEPDKFMPERFLTNHEEVAFSGQNFEYIPFGSGRRSCPGILLAMQVTHLTLARLLQGFDISTPLNEPVDLTEEPGINLNKATPLEVFMTPRLPSQLYKD